MRSGSAVMSGCPSRQVNVYEIDPTSDERWEHFVQTQPRASIFHTRAWVESLRDTYGYTPRGVTTSAPGTELTNGLPFCEISGLFGKRRLVSLPFSDHCQPLVQSEEQFLYLAEYLERKREEEKWDYVELRPIVSGLAAGSRFEKSQPFVFHKLDLQRNPEDLFASFHKDCIQRKIRRAEKEALACENGNTESLLRDFYQLMVITRRRHGLPTQPIAWFENLVRNFGPKLTISVASTSGCLVAAIITIRQSHTLVYKYGCSDHRFNSLGGMQLLFWRAIQRAKQDGLCEFDLGRSDADNLGLIAFKDRWGATQSKLDYLRCGMTRTSRAPSSSQNAVTKYIVSHTPKVILNSAGKALYRHMG
jgi:CelD/BcsL family acetyltransferase involved in cellulose biosynthesis